MRLLVEHQTRYRYREPVTFNEHRLMLKPQESHDLAILDFSLTLEPLARVSWHHDVFGNSVAIARIGEPAAELQLFSRVLIKHRGNDSLQIPIAPHARFLPVRYDQEELADLAPTGRVHYEGSRADISAWLDPFLTAGGGDTWEVLTSINDAIRRRFEYRVRLEEGIQTPRETLARGSGTCRDFALLLMESARVLGLAARFVSGYVHDPRNDGGIHGAGHTHAWAQIYVPGPGWVEFDPTNGLVNSDQLIRVAVARDPSQAIPVQGSFSGPDGAALDMSVNVTVSSA